MDKDDLVSRTERQLFDELVKHGIDQDTADQVSQKVAASLESSQSELLEALREARGWIRAFKECLNGEDYFSPDAVIPDLNDADAKLTALLERTSRHG